MGTDGERAALVSGHNLYTEEGVRGEEISPPPVEEEPEPHNLLGQFHQDALTQVGMGSYQWLLGVTAGLCFMADGVQVFILPFLIPSIQAEMCLDDTQVPWLNGISMLGLLIGALSCSLGDHIGRRSLLIFALILHLLFNVGAAFAPTFGVFMTSRLGSSIGLGICYPVACVYLAEFLPQNARGKLSVLLLFWALGGFYVVLLAYLFLPTSGEGIVQELNQHQSSWHRVLLLSSLPSLIAFISICSAPESVRYLLHAGKDVNAIMLYQQMYKWNASRSAQYQLTELELPRKVVSSKPPPSKSVWNQMTYNVRQYFETLQQLGLRQNFTPLVLLSLTWAAIGFSYYGMSIWVPEQLQNLKDANYFSWATIIKDKVVHLKTYHGRLENQQFENVTFDTSLFSNIVLSHITFKNCTFNFTDFSSVHSSKTYFIDSVLENSRIYDADFTPENFVNTQQINVTYLSPKPLCSTVIDYRITQTDKLRENMLRLLTPFIALTVHCLCLYNFSRNRIGVVSMLLCSLMSIACWFLYDEIPILVLDFVWSIIFLFAFNSVNIITVEAFPIHLRATGFGMCFAWFRLLGLASAVFSFWITPFTICFLLIGGIALFRLQDTSFNLM